MERERRIGRLCAAILLAWLAAGAASADGVYEINQACVSVGCVPGDSPGFPVEIDRPGSYRLTSNLATGNRQYSAILVESDDVHIDLAGFTIACSLSRQPSSRCTGADYFARGISAPTADGLTVQNGTIRGRFAGAIVAEQGSTRIDQVTIRDAYWGVRLGKGSIVEDSLFKNTASDAIRIAVFGQTGAVSNAQVLRNRVINAGGMGIVAGSRAIVLENVVENSGRSGISASNDCLVLDNLVTGNGDDGINIGFDSGVRGNVIADNGNIGLKMGATTAYRENVIGYHPVGGFTELGLDLGDNSCAGYESCQ